MPKIVITEKDTTGVIQQSSISNVVYVPIRAQAGADEEVTKDTPRYTDIAVCRSISDLNAAFDPDVYENELDWKICKHLINIGFEVLVQGWISSGKESQEIKTYQNITGMCTTGWKYAEYPKPTGGWPEDPNSLTNSPTDYSDEQGSPWKRVGMTEPEIIVEQNDPSIVYRYGIANYTDVLREAFENKNAAEDPENPSGDLIEDTTSDKYIQYKFTDEIPTDGSETVIYVDTEADGPSVSPYSTAVATFSYYYANNTVPTDAEETAVVYCVSAENSYVVGNTSIRRTTTKFDVDEGVDAEGWEVLKDKGIYDVRFLTHGTFKFSQDMVSVAAKRGDCIALLNANEADPEFSYKATDVRAVFNSVTNGGEYAAAFTPWFDSNNSDLISLDQQQVLVPAAYGYLFAYANSVKNNPEWYAVAGFERGIIPELTNVAHKYTSADIEVLQARGAEEEVDLDDDADNVGFAINPIAYIRPAGYIIWGNRTLLINGAAKKTIATSFLNVRNGVSAIKKVLYTAARKYTFEQNNELLWVNFQAYTKPLLDRMQSGNGLLGYRWIRRSTTAKARLSATLKIVPIEAVEDFELEVLLTDDLEVSE